MSAEKPFPAASGGPAGLLAAIWGVVRQMLAALFRTVHLLWLEVTGLFFVAFALVGGVAAYREYQWYAQGARGPGRTLAAALFALMFGYFGVTSFWKARRRTR